MKIEVKRPEILRISYRQEKGDKGYGSCLWADFDFDQNEFMLNIQSDCGCAGYGWYVTKSETFLQLMSRMSKDYLMNKLFREECVDVARTMEHVRDALGLGDDAEEETDLDPESLEEELEELERTLEMCDDISEARHALDEWAQEHDEYELDCAWEYAVADYSGDQKKTGEIFELYIQPKIREMLKEAQG